MGMFDRDKEYGTIITNFVKIGEPFILWSARIKRDDVQTSIGVASESELVISKTDKPDERFETTTLGSAIAGKVREAEPADFPAVVCLATVDTKYGKQATVIQYLKPYDNDIPF